MRSFKSRMINLILKLLGMKKMFADFHAKADSATDFKAAVDKARTRGGDSIKSQEKMSEQFPSEQIDIDGFALHLYQVGAQKKVLFFLHGGAYVLGLGDLHFSLMRSIGEGADCHVAIFDYPLTPEYTMTTIMERTAAAYTHLLQSYDAQEIVVMGDSAGAGLAAGLTYYLRDHELPAPSQVVLLYPWLDVTMSQPEARVIESKDYLLGVDGLIACGNYCAGELGVEHPFVSPLFGDVQNLPKMTVLSGTWDLLHPQSLDFVQKVEMAGGEIDLHVYEEMQHAWLLFDMPEAADGVKKICAAVRA